MARSMILYFPPTNSTALLPLNVAGGGATASIPLAVPYPVLFPSLARTITITSLDNLSGINFTITGTDQFSNVMSEVIVGPNAATVTSINQYNTVTSIAASGVWTNLSIGYGATGTFQWARLNTMLTPMSTSIQAVVAGAAGSITYSVNQTLDSLGYYENIGSTTSYVGITRVQLGANALSTDAGSTNIVTVTVPTTAGLVTGDIVTISGANATLATITAANLNVTSIITVLSATTFSYLAGSASNGHVTGGGPALAYYFLPYPTSFPIVAALTGATTNQLYDLTSPATAIQGVITASTGGSLTLTLLESGLT